MPLLDVIGPLIVIVLSELAVFAVSVTPSAAEMPPLPTVIGLCVTNESLPDDARIAPAPVTNPPVTSHVGLLPSKVSAISPRFTCEAAVSFVTVEGIRTSATSIQSGTVPPQLAADSQLPSVPPTQVSVGFADA